LEARDSPISNVKSNAKLATKTSINFYRTALCHIPEDSILQRFTSGLTPRYGALPIKLLTAESTLCRRQISMTIFISAHGYENHVPFNTYSYRI